MKSFIAVYLFTIGISLAASIIAIELYNLGFWWLSIPAGLSGSGLIAWFAPKIMDALDDC